MASSQDLEEAARRKPLCKKLQQRFGERVREVEKLIREPEHARFLREVSAMQQRLERMHEAACPEMDGPLYTLHAFLEEHKALYGSMHAADAKDPFVPSRATGKTQADLLGQFYQLHDTACSNAALRQQISARMWCKGAASSDVLARRQRYLLNLSSDDALVHRDGRVGGTCSDEQFVALVQISNKHQGDKQLASLQGQGPILPEDIARYLDAATHFAERNTLGHVIFVNAAEGAAQVPSFADAVQKQPHTEGLVLEYVGTAAWADGGLISPKGAADLASDIVARIDRRSQGSVMVVNCNAGLDRSGMLNVLVQLVRQTQAQKRLHADKAQLLRFGYALIPQLVGTLKKARPHAISSPARYLFIHKAFEAYIDSLA